MNYIEFNKTIKNYLESVYLAWGDDTFLLDKVEEKLQAECGVELKDIDKTLIDGENFSIELLENALMQFPLMAKRRFVVLKNIQKVSESDKKQISKLLNGVSDSCVVLLRASDEGENFSFVNCATKVDCSRLDAAMCKKFVADKLPKNISITQQASNLLVDLCSRNLGKILTELNKLCFSAMDKGVIEEDDVQKSVKQDLEYQVYEISDCLLNKNISRAIKIINDMLVKKEEPTTILSLLTSNFRRIYLAKITPQDDAEVARMLKVKEYAVKIARNKQAKLGANTLKQINEMLVECDYMIKSGAMPADIALFYAVMKIYTSVN